MPRNDLEWLDGWYQRQCNGEWEHTQGVRLKSLDRSGLAFDDQAGGNLGGEYSSSAVAPGYAERRLASMLDCRRVLRGSGDPRKLEQIIGVFRRWVETERPTGS